MSEDVIQVQNLSKQYRLGTVGTGTLAHDLNRWWQMLLGREDPYLMIGETNDRTGKGSSDYVWSLKDINFDVKQGDIVGVIGRNGAGKSTLLKILSRTTSPTTGDVRIKGRIASLLEVGTGFHPELTGGENIFLNGAILGMTKKEIKAKFDEIVDFSGVERYIDTPVKRYSSGMYVRLAFAVAAHLESEILIVDEVLAVGDAEFQKKCMGKMGDVSKAEGRTIVFVSHNMAAVRQLCRTGLLLENGMMKSWGNIDDVIGTYFKKNEGLEGHFTPGRFDSSEKVIVQEVKIRNQFNTITEVFKIGDDLIVDLKLIAQEECIHPTIAVGIKSKHGFVTIANTMIDNFKTETLTKGENYLSVTFKNIPLLPQEYYLSISMRTTDGKAFLMYTKEIGYFVVTTKMKDLGIDSSLSEEIVLESVSPFIPYEWNFGNGNVKSFNILNNVKR